MREATDGQLVLRAASGDDPAFDELVARYRTRVYHLALSKVRGRENALDIAQEAFVQAYLSLRTLREPEKFGPWLSGITANLCRMHFRRLSEVPLAPDVIDELWASAEPNINAATAREALDQLPDGTRTAAMLYFVEGMKQTEIAEFLGISLAAVKSRIRDARASLQKEMVHMVKQTANEKNDRLPDDPPVVRIAYTILQQAILHRAGEIVVEPKLDAWTSTDDLGPDVLLAIQACEENGAVATPGEAGLSVSMRVGEDWQALMPLPDYLREPITKAFKRIANVDLACTDESQQGRIPIRWHNINYMLALGTTPSSLGETVTMRFEVV